MEKEKLVHYVPAGMVDRLKKLLVRLWETRNPAAAQLGDILKEVEPEIRSLNDTLFDISAKERDTTIREKDKNWAQEREKLRAESERALEELRAAASARLEKANVAFACEKAELNEAVGRAQKEAEALAAENRRMKGRLEGQEAELKRRLFEAKAEFERESGRRVQEAVEQITGHLLLALKAAEQKLSDSSSEAAREKEENGRLRAALAERTRRLEENIARQAEELEVKEHDLASLRATERELGRQLVELNEAHLAELRDKLRGKESELNKAAAERLETEREEWSAQGKRQEALLAKTAEDLRKAKKETEDLAAENRRLGDSLSGKEDELQKRLFTAKAGFERETGRRVQEAVEEVTARLLAALRTAEKKNEAAAAEAAHAIAECSRLKDALAERERQFKESCEWQAQEAAARERYLDSSHEKVKELEKKIFDLNEEHAAELTDSLRDKEAGFRARQENVKDEFEMERAGYLRSIAGLRAGFESEKGEWEEKRSAAAAALKASLDKRMAELERDLEARHAAEVSGKEQNLASALARIRELEKRLVGSGEEHHAELMEKMREKDAELRSRLDEAEKEKAEALKSAAGLAERFEEKKRAWVEGHEREHAARAEAAAAELREKKEELDREAAKQVESALAAREAQSRRQEEQLARTTEDFKKAQKEIADLAAESRRLSAIIAEKEKGGKFTDEAQFNEAVARERERLAAGYEARRAALEAETKDLLAAYREKEKRWAAEKERCESELALCSVSTRSFVAEEERKLKADLAKWKEALEEEYKERLAEQLRARDVLLISEKARLTQEFMEKYAALETKFESLRDGLWLKTGKPPGKKKRGA